MIIPGLIAAFLIIFFSGLGLTLLAARGQARVNLAEICALSWFFGTGAISLLLWVGGLLFTGAALQAVVTILALGLGLFGLMRARENRISVAIPYPRNLAEWIL